MTRLEQSDPNMAHQDKSPPRDVRSRDPISSFLGHAPSVTTVGSVVMRICTKKGAEGGANALRRRGTCEVRVKDHVPWRLQVPAKQPPPCLVYIILDASGPYTYG